ncbi:MAG: carbohydrate ABC transporter permease [Anaerolineae bacterium]|nr:carbohydrate ABC transporter permease [Anaerolineae bacterium]
MAAKRTKTRWGVHLALIAVCALVALPALYAVQMATLTFAQTMVAPPQVFPPGGDLLANLTALFQRQNFGTMLVNTTLVALVVALGKTSLGLLAALAFVYFRFPGKTVLFFAVLFTLLLPTEIILLPLFRMMSDLGWGEAHPRLALTVPFLATAAGTFLFRQHFSNIPRELAEAAQIDGAAPLRFLLAVLIPMSWNVIGAHLLVQFIASWNQYLWSLLIVSDPAQQMIQVGVKQTMSAGLQTDFGLLMTAGVAASLPPLILFVALHRQFMNGFSLTQDK